MVIRPVRWSDFPTFVEFYYSRYDEVTRNPDLFLYTQAKKPALGEEAIWFGSLMREILDGDTVCMVAEEDGRVVGAADVRRKGHHTEERHAGIYANAIVPECRGKGIGDELISTTLKACTGKFEVLYLIVVDQNERAKKLYRKHGFVECGRFPRGFKRGERYLDDILMWRALG